MVDTAQGKGYGEPWNYDDHIGLVAEGNVVLHEEDKKRAAACVNALAGCPDPQAFVNAVQEARDAETASEAELILEHHWAISWVS